MLLHIHKLLTAYVTLKMFNFPLRIQADKEVWVVLQSISKYNMADWIALKKDMMAVVEYSNGYRLPILACMRNHEDHMRLPAVKTMDPITHLS